MSRATIGERIGRALGRRIPPRVRFSLRRARWRARAWRRRFVRPIAAAIEALEPRAPRSTVIAADLPEQRRDYRVLLPVSRPESADRMARVAAAMAHEHGGEVIVVSVLMPEGGRAGRHDRDAGGRQGDAPSEPSVADRIVEHPPAVRAAMARLEAAGVPSGFVVRQSNDVGGTLRREARRQRADLIVIGWSETPGAPDEADEESASPRPLPASLSAIVEYPPADVLVVAGQGEGVPSKLLVPTGIGGDSLRAIRVADILARASDGGEITLLRILPAGASLDEVERGMSMLAATAEGLSIDAEVSVVRSDGIGRRIVGLVGDGDYDGVVVAGLDETLGSDQILGGVQLRLARECRVPVLVLRRSAGELAYIVRRSWKLLFALTPTLDAADREHVESEITAGATPSVDYFVMIGLSALIAAFGLLLDSAAVIIGAMLVAPLMSAIVAVGLGVVEGELGLIRRGLKSAVRGAGLAIGVAVLAGLIYTGSRADLPTEIMSRTRPQLLDLGVAVASGAAAAYALARRSVSAALPGVAIAAALVPPLAVVGIGVANRRPDVALGALLLFVTNFVAIVAAGGLTFLLLGFGPSGEEVAEREVLRRGMRTAGALLAVVALALGAITFDLVRGSSQDRRLAAAFERIAASDEFTQFRPFEILDYEAVEVGDGSLSVSAVIQLRAELLGDFTYRVTRSIQDQLAAALDRPVALTVEIIPTRTLSAREPPSATPRPTATETPSASPSASPSSTATETPTVRPSATPSASATETQTASPPATPSPLSSPTAVPTGAGP